jgi:hypothetical protein
MVRGRKRHSKISSRRNEDDVEADDDIQSLRRSGKVSFDRDETFENSEDECSGSCETNANNKSLHNETK